MRIQDTRQEYEMSSLLFYKNSALATVPWAGDCIRVASH